MKRHWSHWIGAHDLCHPARCKKAADECNRIESELRSEQLQLENRSRLRSGLVVRYPDRKDML